jgi:transcriptional regulator with XRE-family HTH domain
MNQKVDYSESYKAVANRLKVLRKAHGYKNYEHIAFELNMSRSAYWRLESGVNFELKTLIKICELFKITLSDFFSDINFPIKEEENRER